MLLLHLLLWLGGRASWPCLEQLLEQLLLRLRLWLLLLQGPAGRCRVRRWGVRVHPCIGEPVRAGDSCCAGPHNPS